jgi:hypothetical protein
VDLVLVVEEKHPMIECPTLMLWLLMTRQACGVKQQPPWAPSSTQTCQGLSLMDEGEAFYQLQQVSLIFRPNLGGWRLAFCLLVSLMLTICLPL